jgi:hypothetical protein
MKSFRFVFLLIIIFVSYNPSYSEVDYIINNISDIGISGEINKIDSVTYKIDNGYLFVFMSRIEEGKEGHVLITHPKNLKGAKLYLFKDNKVSKVEITNGGLFISQDYNLKYVNLNMVLTNNEFAVPKNYPDDFVSIYDYFSTNEENIVGNIKDNKGKREALENLRLLFDSVNPLVKDPIVLIRAFRSIEHQTLLYELNKNQAVSSVAIPGHSEHHLGLAFDLIRAKDIKLSSFDGSYSQKILHEKMIPLGFILRYPKDKTNITGIIYEPWHIRFVGSFYSKLLTRNSLTMEEFYTILDSGVYYTNEFEGYMRNIKIDDISSFTTNDSSVEIYQKSDNEYFIKIPFK